MTTLIESLEKLKMLVEQVENGDENITIDDYNDAIESVQQRVDRRIALIQNSEALIESHKKTIERLQSKIATLNRVIEHVKNDTMQLMKANHDIEFNGTLGKFKIVKNGGKLPVVFDEIAAPQKIDRVVKDGLYPEEWTETRTVKVLKKEFEDAVRQEQVKLEFVHVLERGEHLRIL